MVLVVYGRCIVGRVLPVDSGVLHRCLAMVWFILGVFDSGSVFSQSILD